MTVKCSICGRPMSKEIEKDIVKNFLAEFEITCIKCVKAIQETDQDSDDNLTTLRGM